MATCRGARWSAVFLIGASLAACVDAGVGPTVRQGPASVGVSLDATAYVGDTAVTTFTVSPSIGATYVAGPEELITFPAASICDPARSTYGPTEWDAPCAPATSPITITSKVWRDPLGHRRVDFSPALRFVPTADPAQWVTLSIRDELAALPGVVILYCASASTLACLDESLTDLTLTTHADPTTGWVSRRIKHFSGYNVAARQ
jgi:hypothetical protein